MKQRTLVVLGASCVLMVSCGSSDAKSGDTNPGGTPSEEFRPAVAPADPCALVTTEDVGTFIENPDVGYSTARDSLPDLWFRDCYYSGANYQQLEILIKGALTERGKTNFAQDFVEGNLSGSGDTAWSYFPDEGTMPNALTILTANQHSYHVEIDVFTPQPGPQKEPLIAFMTKVLGQLQ